jgi:hypothetical protein
MNLKNLTIIKSQLLNYMNQNVPHINMSNYIMGLVAFFSIPYILIFGMVNRVYGLIVLGMVLGYAGCIGLNMMQYTKVARLGFIALISGGVRYFYHVLGNEFGIQNLFMILIIIPHFIFARHERHLKWGTVFIVMAMASSTIGLGHLKSMTRHDNVMLLYYIIFLSIAVMLYLIVCYYINRAEVYIQNLTHTQKKLKRVNVKLNQVNQQIHEVTQKKTEYNIAQDIQTRFLPDEWPQLNGIKFHHAFLHDYQDQFSFVDFHLSGKDRMGIIIFEILDKGIGNSFTAIKFHTAFQSINQTHMSAKDMLSLLNKEMYYLGNGEISCGCFYLQLNLKTKKMTYADTGIGICFHDSQTGLKQVSEEGGFPLGMLPDTTYTEGSMYLKPGDIILAGTSSMGKLHNNVGHAYIDTQLKPFISKIRDGKWSSFASLFATDVTRFTGQNRGSCAAKDMTVFTIICEP